jgi:hypothetical protein
VAVCTQTISRISIQPGTVRGPHYQYVGAAVDTI